MRSGVDERLARECRTLTRYLTGVDATHYVVEKYARAHETLQDLAPAGRFDALLLRLAGGPAPVRKVAAAFARLHAPNSALQARLVTLLAILETTPPTSGVIDRAPHRNPVVLVLGLGARSLFAAMAIAAAVIVLTPLRWALSGRGSDR